MRRAALVALAATLFAAAPSLAQQQPYAGLEARPVKALSDARVADLRAGRGMGLALAAELNGYPGPIHVIELADALELSDAQRTRVQEMFGAMKAEAIPLGERLIEQERELDRLFAGKTVTPESLEEATAAIGRTQGALRAAHLRYHLFLVTELTPEQVRRYGELRGYSGAAAPSHGTGHHGTK
jgi:hypothetical protein